jgi:hypothetical protein
MIPQTWRRAQIPPCPNCGRDAAPALHKGCGTETPDLYLDITTGRKRCAGCGREAEFENWIHHCTHCCGVSEGGEIWQGMAAEAGRMGDLAWLRAAGVRRGTLETTFLGWSSCLACGRRFNKKTGWLITGARGGGICPACHDEAKMEHATSFRFTVVQAKCSWCGFRTSERGLRVRVGKAHICRSCTEEIQRFRPAADRKFPLFPFTA